MQVREFDERGQCIARLYSGFELLHLHVKGNMTLGENIADFGGIKSAYNGWLAWYTDNHCKGPRLDVSECT
jgi:predicted metalloendopeptidase